MNLNGNSRFSIAPRSDIQRSVFDRSFSHKTTFNAGELVPVYFEDVLPGDTVSLDLSSICRMTTPLYPVMDNSWLDFHFFFVPMRLVWSHTKEFFGENSIGPWDDATEYEVPHTSFTVTPGTFFDYLGVVPQTPVDISTLPWRAYCLIWNEWFRDQNLQDPEDFGIGDIGDPAIVSTGATKMNSSLLKVNKYKDYFTSCLPSPQKGHDVTIGLGDWAPVKTRTSWAYDYTGTAGPALNVKLANASLVTPLSETGPLTVASGGVFLKSDGTSGSIPVTPINLWADLSNAISPTINDLRHAFAIQRLLELDARGGTRYRELVKAHFGVDTGDARVQVPEYLGGKHIPINVSQVIQQSNSTDTPTPLGNTGAFSKTVDRGSIFTKSFTEHGFLMGFCSVRTDHTYQQGVPRSLMRRNRYDYYWPELAHIGEQPVKVSEIYADADPTNELVFGYQEAWADYRYSPNRVSATFRSNAPGTLDVWHYADDYESRPYLSSAWISETDANIARTLAVTASGYPDQFLLDCYFKASWARPMPVYSIPGLGGHF